jgi:uncharacterized protein
MGGTATTAWRAAPGRGARRDDGFIQDMTFPCFSLTLLARRAIMLRLLELRWESRARPRHGLARAGTRGGILAVTPSGTRKMVNRSSRSAKAGRFDAFGLAARGESLGGEVDVAGRERISDRLAPTSSAVPIAWQISGGQDGIGRPMLTVTIEGSLPLVCQRCLQPFELPVKQQTNLLLARAEAELEPLDNSGEAEVVLAAAPLDAMTLVEDEILLSLPFAPNHAEEQCPARVPAAAAAAPAPGATSPFARLSALKKGTDGFFKE